MKGGCGNFPASWKTGYPYRDFLMKITRISSRQDGSMVQVAFDDRQEYGAFLTSLRNSSIKCHAGLQRRNSDLPVKWLISQMEENAVPEGKAVVVRIKEEDAMHLFAVLSGFALLLGDIVNCL